MPRFKEQQATGDRVASSGVAPVRAPPLTNDAQALLDVLRQGTDRKVSVTRAELLTWMQDNEKRPGEALTLVKAHGLLELRPVGNLVFFRALTSGKVS